MLTTLIKLAIFEKHLVLNGGCWCLVLYRIELNMSWMVFVDIVFDQNYCCWMVFDVWKCVMEYLGI